ncbi:MULTISPECIES: SusD/RagB family nutrient-binding outer membrane lipoprotein [Bacteroides]|uniref:SusD/RagB family nutrient-binding outer membrane lipoprotein n=1 Tax=Bacteroides nordii CL02T12C05 TaxID=997884 RepID=I9H2L2_9BACE|nr:MULTISPECIES: SusD/RagB family nutrient-binding outer membrane lipoprotein [Bacteroides]EIY53699.1 hypothetical protein HMPREF1068_00869 [Bacteroides nordii CL02T12C05]EOA59704.1 hypothetical protein HMPREF1214_01121 [Bacteroides sp. HPS0048]MBD9108726.1 SusD/RagB family nutrient-binding outer membrane lipoprotein [Bacteroides nordii]MCG4769950.1 SusD/RagB family nutrient-binding outer membrane lipoprotein [Bacteroides nordii]
MKTIFINYFCLAICMIGLQSCFDFDVPGAENTGLQEVGDPEIHYGAADKIDYHREISEEGFTQALTKLKQPFGTMLTCEFAMRGGKDGNPPGAHAYQFQFNLTVDNYAGYFCLPQNFDGRMVSTYYNSEAFNSASNGSFLTVKNGLAPLMNHPDIDSIPEMKAISLLLYNYASQEIADIYGPFPYINYKENKQEHPYTYTPLQDIYYTIVDNIDTISACFRSYESRPEWYKTRVNRLLRDYDLLTDQKIDTWMRFANSLKLRIAMRVVKILPQKAKQWAEEAVQAGVIENENQQVGLSANKVGFEHPLAMISETWNDSRLNASFESMLRSLEHPYLDFICLPNSSSLVDNKNPDKVLTAGSKIVGLRAGIRMLAGQSSEANPRTAFSRVSGNAIQNSMLGLMKLSEVQFLRAEGALRQWNMGGTAKSFYEAGIRNAFAGDLGYDMEYNSIVDKYMGLENAVKYKYEDPMDSNNDIESVTRIGVKWNEGDDLETKLEKIITQKYIANFPYSFEGWSDMRRTGYPKIFPVLNVEDGDGSLQQGDLIRRMPFPGTENEAVQQDIITSGLDALGGEDKQATRLWWDTEAPNF